MRITRVLRKEDWLKTTFRYGEEDLAGAKSLVDQCPSDDPDTDINLGEKTSQSCLENNFVISLCWQLVCSTRREGTARP